MMRRDSLESSKKNKNKDEFLEILLHFHIPMKIFDGTKSSLNYLTQQSCAYLWFRRIKQIFLQMGKNISDPFVQYDMEIVRDDIIEAFDQYIASIKPKRLDN
ncbi:unnamed protein product, partial [Didymodactylos carnosus]